ncbi:MAG: hypothetical protein WA896_12770 [Spirulinaceae cyanobacterium]
MLNDEVRKMEDQDVNEEQDEQEKEEEVLSLNKLTELGNQAISDRLIFGHGYRGGKYEILRQGEVLLMTPQEAESYLQELIDNKSEG